MQAALDIATRATRFILVETGYHHRRPHAPVRQDLPHPGLRRLHRHPQNGRSGPDCRIELDVPERGHQV
ncbi:MAG: hypothetical protein U5R30_19455 [Deltaproteobacteria bacterium]|nr:hypothetical protein [Deltaproteobacteria bacterium]